MDGLAPQPPAGGDERTVASRLGRGRPRTSATVGGDERRWLRCEGALAPSLEAPVTWGWESSAAGCLPAEGGFEARPWTASHLSHRGSASGRYAPGDEPAAPAEVRVRDPRDPRRPGGRPVDRCGRPADLPGLDVQARRCGRPARRVRVLPLGQPHPSRAGGVPRRARGGLTRVRVRLRAGRRGHAAARGDRPRRHASSPTTRTAAPTACSPRSPSPGAWTSTRSTWATSTRCGRRSRRAAPRWSGPRRRPIRCWASPTSPAWPRSPTPQGPCSSWTTPSPRRTCRARWRSAPTSSCTRRRSTAVATRDVVGGALVAAARVESCADLDERIAFHQNAIGGVAGPFDAWLVLRGLKTLAVRMERHCDNAERIAAWLAEHPRCRAVSLPGAGRASGPRRRRGADAPVRRHGELPAEGRRRGGARRLQAGRGLHVGRVARRGRVADRAPGPDDPRAAWPAPCWRCRTT